jgi:hypothetical protein
MEDRPLFVVAVAFGVVIPVSAVFIMLWFG